MKKDFLVQLFTHRRNYDVAEFLHHQGILAALVTDIYMKKYLLPLTTTIPALNILSKRHNKNIPDKIVYPNFTAGLFYAYKKTKKKNNNFYETIKSYKILSKRSIALLRKSDHIGSIYAYDTGALELFREAAPLCKRLFLEQCIAPRRFQIKMYEQFENQFQLDFSNEIASCKEHQLREEEEWKLAHTIITPSEYVKNALIESGADESKIVVIPYGFTPQIDKSEVIANIERKNIQQKQKLTILFVGNGGVRKGFYDLVAIADNLKNSNIEFRVAGNMENAITHAGCIDNISLLGVLDKAKLYNEYLNADIFILPSYLEGSAMVIQEALSFGLPVVTTNESGSFITHGENGYVYNAGDICGMSKIIEELCNDSQKRYQLAYKSIALNESNSLEVYRNNLLTCLSQ